jgi:DNA-binding response OmpR family regulator
LLIVEDELFVGLDVAEELEAAGYSVYGPISNTKSAGKVVDLYDFDAAILDYRLQDGTSSALADRLIETGVPVIFYTGNDRQIAEDYAGRATKILAKPLSASQLTAEIDALFLDIARQG